MQRIQIVVFDVDGTLIDESDSLRSQTDQVAWKFGHSVADRQRVVDAFFRVNDRAQHLKDQGQADRKGNIPWYMTQMGDELGCPVSAIEAEKLARDWSAAYRQSHDSPRLFADALQTLEQLAARGYRLVVASGNTVETREKLLGGVGVRHFFEAIYAAIDVGFQKQDIRFWTALIDDLGSDPRHLAVIGNQVNDDILHPAALGMMTCLVRRRDELTKNLGPDGVKPTYTLGSLSELLTLLPTIPHDARAGSCVVHPRHSQ